MSLMAQSGHPNSVSRCHFGGKADICRPGDDGAETLLDLRCYITRRRMPHRIKQNAHQHFSQHASDDLHLGREARDFDKTM